MSPGNVPCPRERKKHFVVSVELATAFPSRLIRCDCYRKENKGKNVRDDEYQRHVRSHPEKSYLKGKQPRSKGLARHQIRGFGWTGKVVGFWISPSPRYNQSLLYVVTSCPPPVLGDYGARGDFRWTRGEKRGRAGENVGEHFMIKSLPGKTVPSGFYPED